MQSSAAKIPIVVMGPSGCGKSTLARAISRQTGRPFIEGDEHHPPPNIAKLTAGEPLTEEDRAPFLDSIGHAIQRSPRPPVVSCSTLRRSHRERLRRYAPDILFIWIDVETTELERRVERRKGHFMSPSLVADQVDTLEPPAPPERFVRVDGALSIEEQLQALDRQL